MDRLDAALNPPQIHQGDSGEGKSGKSGKSQPDDEAAEQARQELEQAAQELAKDMQEARDAGLRPGQLPPPGAGDGSGAEFKNPPKPVNLPDPDKVNLEDLVENWARLKPKDRQQVLDRVRAQWPESYRKAIEAYLAAIGNRQGGQSAPKPPQN